MRIALRAMTLLAGVVLVAATSLISAQSHAQTYPSRPIKLIVPVGPGSNSDIVSRLIGEKLSERLGQPVVIETKPGAGGNIGAEFVAKSEPDGYTLLFASNATHGANKALYKSIPFDPLNDFAPIAFIDWTPMLVVVRADSRHASIVSLLADAKSRPTPINVAIPSTSSRVVLAEINRIAGTNFESVLYKTSGTARSDLLGGHIEVLIDTVGASLPLIRAGTARALAISMSARTESLPDVPTLAEAGLVGFSVSPWNIIVAPKGTSPAIVEKLSNEIRAVVADPTVQRKLKEDNGLTFGPDIAMTPPEVRQFVARELDKWGRIIRAANIQE